MDETKPKLWMHKSRKEQRYWWHYGRNVLHIQLSKPRFSMSFGISTDGEHHFHGDLFGMFWHVECWNLAKKLPPCNNSFRFYWLESGLWLSLWGNDWEGRSDDPWWRGMFHLDVPDLLLGKSKFSKRELETFENVVIPMPERNFRATMTFEECTWKRPRWFPLVRNYTNISLDKEAPKFPGKGENDWDQGDDCIWRMSTDGHDLPKAIGGYVESVMRYRERRSGRRSFIYSET